MRNKANKLGKQFRYSNGFQVIITYERILIDTEYYQFNEISENGESLAQFIKRAQPGDIWRKGFESLQRT